MQQRLDRSEADVLAGMMGSNFNSDVLPLGSATAGTEILAATSGKFAQLQSNGTNWVTLMAN